MSRSPTGRGFSTPGAPASRARREKVDVGFSRNARVFKERGPAARDVQGLVGAASGAGDGEGLIVG